jgi:nucleoside-diphosphate-sugar epimerase
MVKNILSTDEHIIQIPRFFTVYGPFGRPDMSILRFIHWIESGEEVLIYGDGEQKRSFTYVSDIVNGLSKLIDYEESGTFNFGSNKTWSLNNVIEKIENKLDSKANINFKERAFRDVDIVLPNLKKSESKLGWTPLVDLDAGLDKTITWYKKYKEELRNVKFKYEYEK